MSSLFSTLKLKKINKIRTFLNYSDYFFAKYLNQYSLNFSWQSSIVQQTIANDRPRITQKVFKNGEKTIGATGFEPAT